VEENKEKMHTVYADKNYRNMLLVVYLFIIIFGVIFFTIGMPYLIHAFQGLKVPTSLILGEILVIFFLLSFIIPAAYLISVGRKIKVHGQFPYPGMKVIRNTRILWGKQAFFRANALVYFGYCACALSILSSISIYFIFHKIWSSPLISQLRLF